MKKLLYAMIIIAAAAAASAYDDGDSQAWIKLGLSGKLLSNVTVKAESEFRYGDDASEFYEQYTLLGVDYTATEWLKIGLAHQEIASLKQTANWSQKVTDGMETYSKVSDTYWTQEERPTLDITLSEKLAGCGLEDRVRVEYRMKENEDEYFRYRNRIKAKTPWKWTEYKINPYTAWEVYYSDKDTDPDWDRHRFYAGATFNLYKALKADLYYCLQRDLKSGDWTDVNVAGLGISAAF